MKNSYLIYLFAFAFILTGTQAWGQSPCQPEQDCEGAIALCGDVFTYAPGALCAGGGNVPDEIPTGSCLVTDERYSTWYKFKVQTPGLISFIITPDNSNPFTPNDNGTSNEGGVDYDFALFKATNGALCADISANVTYEVACNYSGTPGPTGLFQPIGTTGDVGRYDAPVMGQVGDIFILVVDNYSFGNDPTSNNGYTIDFSFSQAGITLPTGQPELDTILKKPDCLSSELIVSFNKPIVCEDVNDTTISIFGPNGIQRDILSIVPLDSADCDLVGSQRFAISFDSIVIDSGYTLIINPGIFDFCGNSVPSDTIMFDVDPFVEALLFQEEDSVICGGQSLYLTAATSLPENDSTKYSFIWSALNGGPVPTMALARTPLISQPDTGTFTYKVVASLSTCQDSAEVSFKVDATPVIQSLTTDKDTVCYGEEITITIVTDNAYSNDSYSWTRFPRDNGLFGIDTDVLVISPEPEPDETNTFRYFVTVENRSGNKPFGCESSGSISVVVGDLITSTIKADTLEGFVPLFVEFTDSTVGDVAKYRWQLRADSLGEFKDYGFRFFLKDTSYNYLDEGAYEVQLTLQDFLGCTFSSNIINIQTLELRFPNVITPNNDGKNDVLILSKFSKDVGIVIYNRWGKEVYKSDTYQDDFAGEGLPAGTYFMEISDRTRGDKKVSWFQIMR